MDAPGWASASAITCYDRRVRGAQGWREPRCGGESETWLVRLKPPLYNHSHRKRNSARTATFLQSEQLFEANGIEFIQKTGVAAVFVCLAVRARRKLWMPVFWPCKHNAPVGSRGDVTDRRHVGPGVAAKHCGVEGRNGGRLRTGGYAVRQVELSIVNHMGESEAVRARQFH